jgi:hypothetical protein
MSHPEQSGWKWLFLMILKSPHDFINSILVIYWCMASAAPRLGPIGEDEDTMTILTIAMAMATKYWPHGEENDGS